MNPLGEDVHVYLFIIDFFLCYKRVNVTDICKGMKLSKLLWNEAMKGIKESLLSKSPALFVR